jgi:MYXO-CTERM domain-containing protein
MMANSLNVGNDSSAALLSGSVINSQIALANLSELSVFQPDGVLTGLTLNGNWPGSLSIDDSSVLKLYFGSQTEPNWIFRWQDPSGSNWMSTLDDWIDAGRIWISAPYGWSLVDDGGYTYIEGSYGSQAVPEPSTLVLWTGLGAVGLIAAWRRRKRAA